MRTQPMTGSLMRLPTGKVPAEAAAREARAY
jgi:hypothetical protein